MDINNHNYSSLEVEINSLISRSRESRPERMIFLVPIEERMCEAEVPFERLLKVAGVFWGLLPLIVWGERAEDPMHEYSAIDRGDLPHGTILTY